MAEEKGVDFIRRMWKQYFPKDVDLPKTIKVDTRDLSRLVEGYGYWLKSLDDPKMAKARELIFRVAGELEAKAKDGL